MKCPRCGFRLGISKSYADDIRKDYPRAFLPWTPDEDKKLEHLSKLATIPAMAEALGRQPTALKRRMELLGIVYTAPQLPNFVEGTKDRSTWTKKEQDDLKRLEG